MPPVRAQGGGREFEFRFLGAEVRIVLPPSEESPVLPPAWLVFSPVEQSILRALLDKGPLSREQVASAVGEPLDGKLKFLLPNLVARRVLVNTEDGLDVNADAAGRERLRSLLAPPGSA